MIHNILIIDANRSLSATHASLLIESGFEVAMADNLSAASAQLRSTAYSLVITEFTLWDSAKNGDLSLIRHIRTLRPGTPVLVLTSRTNPVLHRRARGLGVWDIALKPTPPSELVSLVKNILVAVYPERSKCASQLLDWKPS